MEDDLYGAGDDSSGPTPDPMGADAGDEKPEETQGEPVLVNKELCEDCQPGDRLIVEVLKDHGKELEIRYVGKEKGEDDMPPGDMPPEMAEAGGGDGGGMMD